MAETAEEAAQQIANSVAFPSPPKNPPIVALPNNFFQQQRPQPFQPQQPQSMAGADAPEIFGACRSIPEVAEMFSKGKLPEFYLQISYISGRPRKRRGDNNTQAYLPSSIGRYAWNNIVEYIKTEVHPGKFGAQIRAMMKSASKQDLDEARRLEKLIPEHLAGNQFTFEVGIGGGGMSDPVQDAEDSLKILELETKKEEIIEKKEAKKAPVIPIPPPLDVEKVVAEKVATATKQAQLEADLAALKNKPDAPKTDVVGIATAIAAIFAPVLPLLAQAFKPAAPPPPPPPPDNSLALKQMEMQMKQMEADTARMRIEAEDRRAAEAIRAADERARADREAADRREDAKRQTEFMMKMFEDKSKPKDKSLEDRMFALMEKRDSGGKSNLKEFMETFAAIKEISGGFGGNGRGDDDGFDPENVWGSLAKVLFQGLKENLPAIAPLVQTLLANPQARQAISPEDRQALQSALPPPAGSIRGALPVPPPMRTMPVASQIPPPMVEFPVTTQPAIQTVAPLPPVSQNPAPLPPVGQSLVPTPIPGSNAADDMKAALLAPADAPPAVAPLSAKLIDPVQDTRESMLETLKEALVDIQVQRQVPLWIDHALADWPKKVQVEFSHAKSGEEALEYMRYIINDQAVFGEIMGKIEKEENGRYQLICHIIQLSDSIKQNIAAALTGGGGNA